VERLTGVPDKGILGESQITEVTLASRDRLFENVWTVTLGRRTIRDNGTR
jgi:hypothetical protein